MSASSFADKIIDKLDSAVGKDGYSYSSATSGIANQAIAEAVTEYLTDNTKINVAYVGTIPGPPPTPDPIVSDVCPITGSCAPPFGTTFDTWIKSLESNIVAGFFINRGQAGVTPISPAPAFIPGLSISQVSLRSTHENNLDDPQKPVWEVITGAILSWLNSIVAPSYAASTSQSTGIATPTKTNVT